MHSSSLVKTPCSAQFLQSSVRKWAIGSMILCKNSSLAIDWSASSGTSGIPITECFTFRNDCSDCSTRGSAAQIRHTTEELRQKSLDPHFQRSYATIVVVVLRDMSRLFCCLYSYFDRRTCRADVPSMRRLYSGRRGQLRAHGMMKRCQSAARTAPTRRRRPRSRLLSFSWQRRALLAQIPGLSPRLHPRRNGNGHRTRGD